MAQNSVNLNEQQKAQIREGLENLEIQLTELRRAKTAGIDVEDELTENKRQTEAYKKLLEQYG